MAEVLRRCEGPLPKSLDSDENLKPQQTRFCRDIIDLSRFSHFLKTFGQKCFFGSKTAFLGQEVHYYMVNIAYYTELNLQICNYVQKRRIYRDNSKYLTKTPIEDDGGSVK